MLRLVLGIVLGALVGAAVAALAVKVLMITTLGALVAYPMAVLVGVLTGLVAGKPIWAKGARIEAGLKAVFGALLAAGLMYALRTWVGFEVDLSAFGLGQGALGQLSAVVFPTIAVLLSLVFEVDNLFGKKDDDGDDAGSKTRVAGDKAKVRVGGGEVVEAELESEPRASAKKRR